MKPTILLQATLLLALTACKPEPEQTCTDGIKNQDEVEVDCGGHCAACNISYTESGAHGLNVLNASTTAFSGALSDHYSMSASVPAGSSIKVKLQLTTDPFNGMDVWFYESGSAQNMTVSAYNETTNQQEFQSNGGGNIELNMSFKGNGSATVEIYENGATTPTRTKNITWSV
jgi:hypothetical protein